MPIQNYVPRAIKAPLRQLHRKVTLRKAFAETNYCIETGAQLSRELADRLIYGWSNEGWSAKNILVEYLVNRNLGFSGTFLECGSGLSTILMSIIARKTGAKIFSLEHHDEWHTRMSAKLRTMNLPSHGLLRSPLVSYGEFDWYSDSPSFSAIPSVDLVLCDGPPITTPGGRYGLVPRILPKLASGARIIVDDTHRDDDQRMVQRWLSEYSDRLEIDATFATFTVLRTI
jgi:Methyltransferase domain